MVVSDKNNEQDKEIATLKQRVEDWFVIFDKFVTNDFSHYKKAVWWLFTFMLGGLLTVIILLVRLLIK